MITRFPTLRLEGGLIASDQIDRIADKKAKEFSIDDIAAAWSDIRSYWSIFQNNLARLPEDDLATSITRSKWMIPFFSTLGYDLSSRSAAEVDGQTYAISHRAGNNDDSPPIHIVGIRQSLDRRPESGRPRLAPHSLVQEYLNRTEHLWGIVTNGSTLRILRDSHLLRKQAYIEFDLEQMMKDDLFADFALLFRLIHVSRLPKGIDDADSCLLEQFHRQTVEQGGRVRDHLRDGVEKAIIRFANGFLTHLRNTALRVKVQDKSLEPFEYYQQLLRLIYRFLFLMVSEERNLITDNMAYRQHYSISRIRRLAEVRVAYTGQEDLWLGLATSFTLFQDESLGLLLSVPILNGDLFDPVRTSEINEASLTNRDLLTAMWDICMYREKENAPWRRINYAALDVEELGSVYESLLDFQPVFVQQNGNPEFRLLTGTERKSTGSYYTPPELVNELIQSALVPVIKDRLAPAKTPVEKEAALLALSVCDPACGSGHFLLAAARTIGRELAKARTGDEEPAPEQMRIAIRDSITHCIYGVDKNPLAVDLCKVALWLEGHTKTKPLTFLDHRIRCGDSLVGVFDLKVLEEGIPDNAYTALTGDDKTVAKDLKKLNKEHIKRERQNRSLTEFDPAMKILTASRQQVNAIADDNPDDIRKKKELFSAFQQEGTPWCKDKTVCDLWTAAFFVELTKERMSQRCMPTTESLRQYLTGALGGESLQIQTARRLAKQHRFFHWQLEFPEVFSKGGFDCNLGNPPWGIVELNPVEFFLTRDPEIAKAQNMAARQKMINNLVTNNPNLFMEFNNNKRVIENYQKFIHSSGRFPFTSFGRINSMALFAELGQQMISPFGRSGLILPIGIATDSFNQYFFSNLIEKKLISRLIGFENEAFIFPNIHNAFKFCALTITGNAIKNAKTDLSFFCRNFIHVSQKQRHFELSSDDIFLINPNTRTCPIFRTSYDAELTNKIYNYVPILINEKKGENKWDINLILMFMMNIDSKFFIDTKKEGFLPLIEAKLIHQFDHRFATYENATQAHINSGRLPQTTPGQKENPNFTILSKYWIPIGEIETRIRGSGKKWFLGYRRITSSVVERTMISVIIPFSGSSDGLPICLSLNFKSYFYAPLLANFNSLVFDYCARQKVGGTHLDFHYLKQLPVIPPDRYTPVDLTFIVPRVLELTYTAWDIKAFADDVWRDADDALKALLRQQWEANQAATGGHEWKPPEWAEIEPDGIPLPPFKWDEERRAVLRAELDALYAKLYGLSRDELRYILDPADVYGPEFPGETFRVLKEKEIKKYGEYRTRRLVLEAWERMEKEDSK